MLSRCPGLAMNALLAQLSLMPGECQPTFSPAWLPRWHPRSRDAPSVCEMNPCLAMRTALLCAIEARHELQIRGRRPWLTRSWLISACCVEWMTIAGAEAERATGAAAFGAAGAAARGFGFGDGLELG